VKKKIDAADIVTLETMAEELGLSKETLDLWREKGMPVIKIGKFLRAYRPHVYEWVVTQGEILAKEGRDLELWNGRTAKS